MPYRIFTDATADLTPELLCCSIGAEIVKADYIGNLDVFYKEAAARIHADKGT